MELYCLVFKKWLIWISYFYVSPKNMKVTKTKGNNTLIIRMTSNLNSVLSEATQNYGIDI